MHDHLLSMALRMVYCECIEGAFVIFLHKIRVNNVYSLD